MTLGTNYDEERGSSRGSPSQGGRLGNSSVRARGGTEVKLRIRARRLARPFLAVNVGGGWQRQAADEDDENSGGRLITRDRG